MGRLKPPSKFQFKRFSVWHHRSSMKVGVDGVLIGCWADTKGSRRILDAGSGCGLIALIMAQRCPDALITGIDIDADSVDEAGLNVAESPWSDRVSIIRGSFLDMTAGNDADSFDLIVSNPPFFDSGISDISTRREQARHQGELSPSVILAGGKNILSEGGGVAIILPADLSEGIEAEAEALGYTLTRRCLVRGHSDAPFKRTLMQWRLGRRQGESATKVETLTLEISPGNPTDEYRRLCKDFYLKF